MTPNSKAIYALRVLKGMTLRELARKAGTSASSVSRIERGVTGASDDLLVRLAAALEETVADITHEAPPGAALPARKSQKKTAQRDAPREVPSPDSPEGALFIYTPEEAATWLPQSHWWLRRKATAREIPFNSGGRRVTFTAADILEIRQMSAVRPLAESEPVQRRSA